MGGVGAPSWETWSDSKARSLDGPQGQLFDDNVYRIERPTSEVEEAIAWINTFYDDPDVFYERKFTSEKFGPEADFLEVRNIRRMLDELALGQELLTSMFVDIVLEQGDKDLSIGPNGTFYLTGKEVT